MLYYIYINSTTCSIVCLNQTIMSLSQEINGEPCMPGVETNLAELLLTAAHSRPEGPKNGSSGVVFCG
jgi:hypothetical protein